MQLLSLNKSFKSHGSYKHIHEKSGRTSSSNASSRGESSILLDEERQKNITAVGAQDTIKMDGGYGGTDNDRHHRLLYNNTPAIRESSYQFCSDDDEDDGEKISERNMRSGDYKRRSIKFTQREDENNKDYNDPPSKLIGQFLNKQKDIGEIVLDMDLEMDELQQFTQNNNCNNNNANTPSSPHSTDVSREIRVSFEPSPVVDAAAKESVRRRCQDSPEQVIQEEQSFGRSKRDEILRCTSNNLSFQRRPHTLTATLTRSKTRSRLQDPPPEEIIERIPKSGQLRSGLLGKMGGDDDDETVFGEDLPEEFTRSKFSALIFIEWASLILIVAALLCSLLIHEIKKKSLWDLKLWKWEVMVLVLICGRIQESLFYQYVIETLSGPALLEIQMHDDEEERKTATEVNKLQNAGAVSPPDLRYAFSKSGKVIGKISRDNKGSGKLSRASSKKGTNDHDGITIDHLHKLNPKNVSAWNMKRLVNMVRHGALITLDEQLPGQPPEADDSANQIRSEYEAKAAARKIFLNVARYGSKHIYLEDLMRFMQEEEAVKTMSLFEGSKENGRISKSSLKNWVVNAFRERRALALTLNDTKTAVKKLHKLVNVVFAIIILVIWLLILKIATTEFLLFLSSQLVLVAFVFGNTCKTIFEALIFLFVIHPFDVGDRCEVDGVQMIVEEMNVLTTVFLRYDNLKIIYPNGVLSTKPIHNFYQSPDMGDAIEFCVHITTPSEKIALMRQRIVGYIEGKKEHWCTAPMIILKDVEDFTRLRVAVWPCHKMNHQDMGERWTRRALLVEEMVKIFRELDIQYRLFPLDINVRSVPAPIVSERMPSSWTNNTSTS
ncbi:Mechanosensitive ion channel protein 6 [Citrus sinensis]|uniref:Mechanosensitive ion channel protein 6 n=1 Tax=Citrus sinensis TaxID=2711 RepID=A0ACB8ICQ2_CITSI|nr:Mechanosensitive ion channel protein 6 [Citrus sinensis]